MWVPAIAWVIEYGVLDVMPDSLAASLDALFLKISATHGLLL